MIDWEEKKEKTPKDKESEGQKTGFATDVQMPLVSILFERAERLKARDATLRRTNERIGRDEMFIEIAQIVALRSTCLRARVGAVIVKEGRIISLGYGGSPTGLPHCIDEGVGCLIGANSGCIRTIHAETNAIAFAAKSGINLDSSIMYTTMSPCLDCCKLIINSGVKKVVYLEPYRVFDGVRLLRQVGIIVERFGGPGEEERLMEEAEPKKPVSKESGGTPRRSE